MHFVFIDEWYNALHCLPRRKKRAPPNVPSCTALVDSLCAFLATRGGAQPRAPTTGVRACPASVVAPFGALPENESFLEQGTLKITHVARESCDGTPSRTLISASTKTSAPLKKTKTLYFNQTVPSQLSVPSVGAVAFHGP